MTLAITDDHVQLARVARDVLAERGGTRSARVALDGDPEALPQAWKDIVSLGWLGLHVDERWGGQGYALPELLVVAEELGAVLTPGPFLGTALAAAVLQAVGTDEQRARWLPALCDGSRLAAVGGDGSLRHAGGVADGGAGLVLAAHQADLLLLASGEDLLLVERDGTVSLSPDTAFDPTRPATAVRCTGTPVADVLPGGRAVARRLGRLLAAAEAVGGARACMELSVAYAKVREQFDRPIGSFQAVKHHCTNMLVDTEIAAAATWDAARPADSSAEADLAAAVAAAAAFSSYLRVARTAVQVHGGIGYTWEHDLHLHLRRAAALAALFGSVDDAHLDVGRLGRSGVRRRLRLDLPAGIEQEREAVRAFRAEPDSLPAQLRQPHFARSGYLVPHWPAPYGRGAGPAEQLLVEQELEGVERPSLGLGEWMLPTLLQAGTPDQLDRYMWRSLEGELKFCQLFSEPGAGSDAAAVSTRATRVDGGWRVTGQKVWTSDARACTHGIATVRTNPEAPKHKGITALIIDLKADGVDIRPLREMTGEALFNEVFFDEVFVPDSDVVGEVDNGWRVALAALGNERVQIGSNSTSMLANDLFGVLERQAPDDTCFLRDVGALVVEGAAQRALALRAASKALIGSASFVEGSVAKLFGAEHAQRVTELGMRIAGTAALRGEETALAHDFFFTRCLTIAGGSSEVLRNQIGERILGLPREPVPAR
jgi:alkylation response protein AidB-like acyl-CoA dehydrogenase